jgi:hypothetical protein
MHAQTCITFRVNQSITANLLLFQSTGLADAASLYNQPLEADMDYVGQHSIKINRAARLSTWGAYPQTFSKSLARVDAQLLASLSASQLAKVIDTVAEAFKAGQSN